MKKRILSFFAAIFGFTSIVSGAELKVLQLNTWIQGSNVSGGTAAISKIIDSTDADIILLCEITGSQVPDLLSYLSDGLTNLGKTYYSDTLGLSMGILSRYEFSAESICFTLDDEVRPNPVCKVNLSIRDLQFAVYSAHWDWTHYECYMPRGYSGTTWKKLPEPATDAEAVLEANRLSFRDEGIRAVIEDANKEIALGRQIIFGGDFNEPSHLDWQNDTKDIRDHNGLIINWDASVLLNNAGFKDCYREVYPNPLTHPGFTYPAGNRDVALDKLVWLPDKDERDRIDFIYYRPTPNLVLQDIVIVGPSEDILRGEIIDNDSQDTFLKTDVPWPSDHKGILATFRLL